MAHNEPTTFEEFHDEIARLLDLADERNLGPEARNAVKHAALDRKTERDLVSEEEDWRRSLTAQGFDIAHRLGNLLADADKEMPDRAPELEALIKRRLGD